MVADAARATSDTPPKRRGHPRHGHVAAHTTCGGRPQSRNGIGDHRERTRGAACCGIAHPTLGIRMPPRSAACHGRAPTQPAPALDPPRIPTAGAGRPPRRHTAHFRSAPRACPTYRMELREARHLGQPAPTHGRPPARLGGDQRVTPIGTDAARPATRTHREGAARRRGPPRRRWRRRRERRVRAFGRQGAAHVGGPKTPRVAPKATDATAGAGGTAAVAKAPQRRQHGRRWRRLLLR